MKLQTWLFSSDDDPLPDGLPEEALFLGEAPSKTALCYHENRPDAQWTRADVFTSDWNLRVQRLGAQVRAVAAGPVPGIQDWATPSDTEPLDDASTETRHILLWGRRNEEESMWIELRIPHLMTAENHLHPNGHGAAQADQMVRRRLKIVRHTDPEEGTVLFQRYAGLTYARTDTDDTTLKPIEAQ